MKEFRNYKTTVGRRKAAIARLRLYTGSIEGLTLGDFSDQKG